MSFCRRNRKPDEIELGAVISFLHTLLCMSGGITVLTMIGMLFTAYAGQNLVMYQMTLAVNIIMLVGGKLALNVLKIKNQNLEEKKEL